MRPIGDNQDGAALFLRHRHRHHIISNLPVTAIIESQGLHHGRIIIPVMIGKPHLLQLDLRLQNRPDLLQTLGVHQVGTAPHIEIDLPGQDIFPAVGGGGKPQGVFGSKTGDDIGKENGRHPVTIIHRDMAKVLREGRQLIEADKKARVRLKKSIQPFILRRLKSQVLQEVPARTEITVMSPIS